MRGEPVDVVNRLSATGVVECGIDLCEIPDMRTVQNCGTQLGCLNRVLPAVSDQ